VWARPVRWGAGAQWTAQPLLAANFVPWPPNGDGPYTPPLAAHGLTVNGNNVFVTNYYNGTLVKVPVASDGTAGTAVQEIVTPALGSSQGIRTIDAKTMVTASSNWTQPVLAPDGGLVSLPPSDGSLVLLTLASTDSAGVDTWNLTTLQNGIKGAASVAVANGSFWVAESQASPLIDEGLFPWASELVVNPDIPFRVYRVNESQ
jgi:hypothetical protein